MSYNIDLHVHSYMSDGTYSPKEIIQLAFKKGVKAIALTDHDNIDGIHEAEEEALKYNIDFLKGIEISSLYEDGRILHIIGLGIDTNNVEFLKVYTRMKKARQASVESILKILETKGIYIDIDVLKKNSLNKYLDRYDIHKYFIQSGISNNAQDIWDKYLDPIAYAKDELIKVKETIEIIKKSGGLSFLAHYNKRIGLQGLSKVQMEEHIKYLITLGLNGIERYYPSYSKENIDYLDYLINKYNLIPSGGTDFHGLNRPAINLGTGTGNFFIPHSVYENILEKINNK
ncbi:PHP domain-containing protein [Clostridium sp.]|uniref:PHP domain-containing protein n=1 Tax=Clostridium sp. TaxID=1506 RepID=UPI003D6C8EAB